MVYGPGLMVALISERGTSFPVGTFPDSSSFVRLLQDIVTKQAGSRANDAI